MTGLDGDSLKAGCDVGLRKAGVDAVWLQRRMLAVTCKIGGEVREWYMT